MIKATITPSRNPLPPSEGSILTLHIVDWFYAAGVDLQDVTVAWLAEGGSFSPPAQTAHQMEFRTVWTGPGVTGNVLVEAEVTFRYKDRMNGEEYKDVETFTLELRVQEPNVFYM